jgi:hypothetical protein
MALTDGVAMRRPKQKRTQDQYVEGTLHEFDVVFRGSDGHSRRIIKRLA